MRDRHARRVIKTEKAKEVRPPIMSFMFLFGTAAVVANGVSEVVVVAGERG